MLHISVTKNCFFRSNYDPSDFASLILSNLGWSASRFLTFSLDFSVTKASQHKKPLLIKSSSAKDKDKSLSATPTV